jgi:hypothetical protein
MPRKSTRKPTTRKKYLLIFVAVLVLAAIVMTILELTNTTYIFHKKSVPAIIPTASTSHTKSSAKTSNEKSVTPSATAISTPQSSKVASSAGGSSNSTTVLAQPYGDLVSNHEPGQNGSNTDEVSTCNTTAGASCYIQFTNTANNQTTKLPVQTTGDDGSTTWSWNANILSSGKWQVTAVASLNGQTKSVTDPTQLEIQ